MICGNIFSEIKPQLWRRYANFLHCDLCGYCSCTHAIFTLGLHKVYRLMCWVLMLVWGCDHSDARRRQRLKFQASKAYNTTDQNYWMRQTDVSAWRVSYLSETKCWVAGAKSAMTACKQQQPHDQASDRRQSDIFTFVANACRRINIPLTSIWQHLKLWWLSGG